MIIFMDKNNKPMNADNQKKQPITVKGQLQKDTAEINRSDIKVEVALPCYQSMYDSTFVFSLLELLTTWARGNVEYSISEVDTADIEFARNLLTTNFYYNRDDCSHILFIDNDMGFSTSLINRMINLNEDVVGVVSPRRRIDLKKLHQEQNRPFAKAIAHSTGFILNRADQDNRKDGFIQVNTCGSGILLISRDCITRMMQCCPDIINTTAYRKKYLAISGSFDTFLTPFNKILTREEHFSEDLSFCYRWVQECKGKIFANIDSPIQHVGRQVVSSRYSDFLDE